MNKYLGGGILAGLGYVIYSLLGMEEEETKEETLNTDKETKNNDKENESQNTENKENNENTDKTLTETQPKNIDEEITKTQEITETNSSTSTSNEVSSNIADDNNEILEDLERNKVEISGVSLDEADSNFLNNEEESTAQIIDDDSKTIEKIIQV